MLDHVSMTNAESGLIHVAAHNEKENRVASGKTRCRKIWYTFALVFPRVDSFFRGLGGGGGGEKGFHGEY